MVWFEISEASERAYEVAEAVFQEMAIKKVKIIQEVLSALAQREVA